MSDEPSQIVGRDRVELDTVPAGPFLGSRVARLRRPRRKISALDLFRRDRDPLKDDFRPGRHRLQGLANLLCSIDAGRVPIPEVVDETWPVLRRHGLCRAVQEGEARIPRATISGTSYFSVTSTTTPASASFSSQISA